MLYQGNQVRRQRHVEELLAYFKYFDDYSSLQFQRNWQQLTHVNFTPTDLTRILSNAVIKAKKPDIPDSARGEIFSYIRQDFDIWFSKISQKIHKASPQDVANSAWIMAALDSLYSHDSLADYYHHFRSFIDIKKLKNPIAQKQVHDADLWFFGQSEIPNPKQKNSNKKSILEIEVRNAFGKKFTVESPDEPIIKELPQAIDFQVHDKKHNILNEVDGNTHFFNADIVNQSSKLAYNLHTLFRSALEQKFASPNAIILRIDLFTADKIQHNAKHYGDSTLCVKIFNTATHVQPGVFRTTNDPKHVKRLVHPRRQVT